MEKEVKPAQLILRSDIGMIRDAFVMRGKNLNENETILMLRQTRFNTDGSVPETKIIRLTAEEAYNLFRFWEAESGKRN